VEGPQAAIIQRPSHVGGGLTRDPGKLGVAQHAVAIGVHSQETRVALEHLLEVRHAPVGRRAVPVEAAGGDVRQREHALQRPPNHLAEVLAPGEHVLLQGKAQRRRLRELGSGAKPAVPCVKATQHGVQRGLHGARG